MSVVLQALAMFASQTSTPFDRVESLLKRTDGFTADVKVAVSDLGTATGSYSVHRPSFQRYRLVNDNIDEEFLQAKEATVHVDFKAKEFTWYPPFKFAVEAPEEAGAMLRLSIPLLLTQGTLIKSAPREKWADAGTETVDGHACNILTVLSGKSPSDNDQLRIWADYSGRVLRVRFMSEGPGGRVVTILDMINPSYKALDESAFAVKIPWGFTPTKVQEPKSVRATGQAAELGKWTKLPSMETVEMNSTNPTLVLVTSDDLAPEGDSQRWRGLAERAKKASVRFVQIWIGKKPANSATEWESYWDKDGSFEDAFGPPATPYLLMVVDKALISAWQGWSEGDDAEAAQTLFSPLARRPSR